MQHYLGLYGHFCEPSHVDALLKHVRAEFDAVLQNPQGALPGCRVCAA